MGVFSALPFYLYEGMFNSYIDCFFESISGFTSTGFSTINDINFMEQPFLIWRSSTQWIGGLFFLISIKFWKYALRFYTSASS